MFSWVVEILESVLAFSLKQYLVYSHQSLVLLVRKEVFVAEENSGLYKRELFSWIFSMNLFQF